MKQNKFVINNSFLINPALNTFSDQQTGKETRLEPRLMNVLCFLASDVNRLVTREMLIKEVWNGYGGGDEGLNQAISFLRKLLHDTNKELIETVPTKGYTLRAVISEAPTIITRGNRQRNFWIGGVILVAIVASVYLLFWRSNANHNRIPEPSIKVKVNAKITIKPKRQLEPRPALPPREEDSLSD